MTNYLQYNDPIRITWRKGDSTDPYVDISESQKIINNVIVLSEIPDDFAHVVIEGYNEVYDNEIGTNQFLVNYQNGMVQFHPSKESETVSVTYKGRGFIQYPAERIYAHNENPDVVVNLQQIIDNGAEAIEAIEQLEQVLIDAEQAIEDVEAATLIANTAATNANDSRVAIEANEGARQSAETARASAESSRATAESGRVTAETGRSTAEGTRATQESARVSAESARVGAETTRATNETNRGTAETNRVNAESSRVTAEGLRVTAETNRENAEDQRELSEFERLNNETTREENEEERITAELNRYEAEEDRELAEATRISNESTRQSQESTRQTNTATAITNAENATSAAQTATNNANDAIEAIDTLIDNTKGVGEYNPLTAYKANNFVAYNGSTFIALVDVQGVTPAEGASQWQLAARRGVDGTGSVVSVNSKSPDGSGNVALIPSDIGAATTDLASTTTSGLMPAPMVVKLNGIAEGANNYVHPKTSGNRHIPQAGELGQILENIGDGMVNWATLNKDRVNLENVENYGIATQAEAEAGTATDKYMTPERVAQAIKKSGGAIFVLDTEISYDSVTNTYTVNRPDITSVSDIDGKVIILGFKEPYPNESFEPYVKFSGLPQPSILLNGSSALEVGAVGSEYKAFIGVDNGDGYSSLVSTIGAIADQWTAEYGTDNVSLMTPLRTAQAIAALGGGGVEVTRITSNTDLNTLTTPGRYYVFDDGSLTITNVPSFWGTVYAFIIDVEEYDIAPYGNLIIQKAYALESGSRDAYRIYSGGQWANSGAWRSDMTVASDAEMIAGSDNLKFITPRALKNLYGGTGTKSFKTNDQATASGGNSLASGTTTTASGNSSFASGFSTTASGNNSAAIGSAARAVGDTSVAFGESTYAGNNSAYAEGIFSVSLQGSLSSRINSYVGASKILTLNTAIPFTVGETIYIVSSASPYFITDVVASVSGVNITITTGTPTTNWKFVVRKATNGFGSTHAEGSYTLASGYSAHAEGVGTAAIGDRSHAEGNATVAEGLNSHAEGNTSRASGSASHAQNSATIAQGFASHAEGTQTKAYASNSHSEGIYTLAHNYTYAARISVTNPTTGTFTLGSSVVGLNLNDLVAIYSPSTATYKDAMVYSVSPLAMSDRVGVATGLFGAANDWIVLYGATTGNTAHAEGRGSIAGGLASHAEGLNTMANGNYSHAQNQGTIAHGEAQTAIGKFNIPDTTSAFIIGNGDAIDPNNAFSVKWDGTLGLTVAGRDALKTTLNTAADSHIAGVNTNIDPNTTLSPIIVSNHANCPSPQGNYWYIRTIWWVNQGAPDSKSQIAHEYLGGNHVYARNFYSGTWSSWQIVGGNTTVSSTAPANPQVGDIWIDTSV